MIWYYVIYDLLNFLVMIIMAKLSIYDIIMSQFNFLLMVNRMIWYYYDIILSQFNNAWSKRIIMVLYNHNMTMGQFSWRRKYITHAQAVRVGSMISTRVYSLSYLSPMRHPHIEHITCSAPSNWTVCRFLHTVSLRWSRWASLYSLHYSRDVGSVKYLQEKRF